MQYTNNPHNPYNPYNPYLCNNQHNPNVATAPPLDEVEVNYVRHQMPQNYMYVQRPCPIHPYPYPDGLYMTPITPVEQYNREIQMRKKQQEDDCCCFGLLTILCCCFIN